MEEIEVEQDSLESAYNSVSPELRDALEVSAEAIVLQYQNTQLNAHTTLEDRGLTIETFGKTLLAPDAMFWWFSFLPFDIVDDRFGCTCVQESKEVVVTVPPAGKEGIPKETLAAAFVAKVDSVYSVGGAQAIAALAHGTETVKPVDVIVGPGNIYVSLAKQEVSGKVVFLLLLPDQK